MHGLARFLKEAFACEWNPHDNLFATPPAPHVISVKPFWIIDVAAPVESALLDSPTPALLQ
jgi:hypothetical protein